MVAWSLGNNLELGPGKPFDDRFTLVHFVRQYILEDE